MIYHFFVCTDCANSTDYAYDWNVIGAMISMYAAIAI